MMIIVGTPPFIKEGGGGWVFEIFEKKKGGSDFSHKKGGVGIMGGLFWKGGLSLIFILTNPVSSVIFH